MLRGKKSHIVFDKYIFGKPCFNTFQIFVAGVLDAELGSGIDYYIITVKATDSGSLTCTGTIQIDIGDVNEFAPVFAETFESATVTEGTSIDTR